MDMKKVAISFNIEEFDVPLENGCDIAFDEQMRISRYGAERILDIVTEAGIKVTFFCTVRFAESAPDLIRRMVEGGHEIASHGYYHSDFKPEHLLESRQCLESLTGVSVYGFRMARMMPVADSDIAAAGYEYNSSLHPTFIPGRYNHFDKPAGKFECDGVVQIPASVTPGLRLPLFWLALHNYPMWLYMALVKWTLRHRGALVVYMHPWEFYNLHDIKDLYSLSPIMTHNCGAVLEARLRKLIAELRCDGAEFVGMHELAVAEWR